MPGVDRPNPNQEAAAESLRAARGVHFWLIAVTAITLYLGWLGQRQDEYASAITSVREIREFPTQDDWREWRRQAMFRVLSACSAELGYDHPFVLQGLVAHAGNRMDLLLAGSHNPPALAPDLHTRLRQLAEPRRFSWVWPDMQALLPLLPGLALPGFGLRLQAVSDGRAEEARAVFAGRTPPFSQDQRRRVTDAAFFDLHIYGRDGWSSHGRIAGLIIEDDGGPTLAAAYGANRSDEGLWVLMGERDALVDLDDEAAERRLRDIQRRERVPVSAFGVTVPVPAAIWLGPAALAVGYLYLGLHLRAARGWSDELAAAPVAWIGLYPHVVARTLALITLFLGPVAAAMFMASGGLAMEVIVLPLWQIGPLWLLNLPPQLLTLTVLVVPVLVAGVWGLWPLYVRRQKGPVDTGAKSADGS